MTSSSDLTGSWVNGRDVCNKSSLSINIINFGYEESNAGPVSVLRNYKKSVKVVMNEKRATEEKVIF